MSGGMEDAAASERDYCSGVPKLSRGIAHTSAPGRDYGSGVPRYSVGSIVQLNDGGYIPTGDEAFDEIRRRPFWTEDYIAAIGSDEPKSALTTQIAGDHYTKLKIQPMEYAMANNLNACQHTAIKYITRYRDKNGLEDIRKAIHTLQFLLELEEKSDA